jgi:TonB family protein
MTNTQSLPVFLSANAAFKGNYHKYLRWSMLAAVILTSLLVWLMPKYEPAPYVLRDDFIEIISIEEIKEVIVERQPKEAPPIVRNVEPVDDLDGPEEEFPDMIPIDRWLPRAQEPSTYVGEVFHASSANPRLLYQAKPEYSQIARMSGIEGLVIVKVLVGIEGQVERAQIIQGVHPILNQAAVNAAYRCRFKPGTQRTIPVQAWVSVPYSFRLH